MLHICIEHSNIVHALQLHIASRICSDALVCGCHILLILFFFLGTKQQKIQRSSPYFPKNKRKNGKLTSFLYSIRKECFTSIEFYYVYQFNQAKYVCVHFNKISKNEEQKLIELNHSKTFEIQALRTDIKLN